MGEIGRPMMSEALRFREVEGGVHVTAPASGTEHFLNPSAAAILLMCDGTRTLAEIAQALRDAHGLAAPPLDDVADTLADLDRLDLLDTPDGG
ncbi:MAG: PqqD family peptide modification chaperone [Azospirillaceae bacterium]